MQVLNVNENEAGQRLDKLLSKYLDQAPKSFLYKMMRKKNITLNKKKCDGSERLKEGDEIQLFLSDETIEKFSKKPAVPVLPARSPEQKTRLSIIYEDEHILLVNKPSGMLSQKAKDTDFSLVEAVPPPNKGYGNSTTIPVDVTTASQASLVLLALAETVGARLRKDGKKAEVISVSIKDYLFRTSSHQCRLPAPTNITEELHRHACRLFPELWDGLPIRHLGIHTGRIQDGNVMRQMELFDTRDYGKLERLDRAVDTIRRRYGMDAVKRAVFLESPIDHMSGGMSREKRYRCEH